MTGETTSRSRRRFGLAARVTLALAAAVLLLAISAAVAWTLLTEIRRDQAAVARFDLPRLSTAFSIANTSAGIAAKAPEFAAVENEDERALIRGELDLLDVNLTLHIQRMNSLATKIAAGSVRDHDNTALHRVFRWLRGHQQERAADEVRLRAMDDLGYAMTATLDGLDEIASLRLALEKTLRSLAFKAAHESRRMNRRLAPLRDDLAFFLRTGWSNLDEAAPAREGERQSPALLERAESYNDIAIAATEVKASLAEAAVAPNAGFLSPLQDRFRVALASLRAAQVEISGSKNGDLLDRPINGYMALGEGGRGIFAVRQQYFDALAAQQNLLAEARRLAKSIATAADKLVLTAENTMRAAADRGAETVRVGMRVLLGLTAVAALAALVFGSIYIGRGVVGRIRALSDAMRRMANGDLETPAPITGADEITDMSESLEVFRQYAREAQRLNRVEQLAAELRSQNETLQETLAKLEVAEAETKALARFPEENPNPVLRMSSDRTVLYANSAANAVDGMVLPGMRAAVSIAETTTEAFITGKPVQTVFEAGEQAFLMTAAAVRGENYINVYGREITDERRAQAQIVAQEKMASLGQLTAGIAHEIKNPLNFVNNFAKLSTELLEDLTTEVESAKENINEDTREEIAALVDDLTTNLARINEHGRRADSIVRGMLDHSRKESGDAQVIEINKLVNDFIDLAFHGLRGQDRSFNSAIEKSFDDDAGEIEVGAQDISRVILNIANNAFHATHALKQQKGDAYSPMLEVSTKSLGAAGVEIRIQDNGPGMPEAVRKRIFEPFFTTKPTGEGTGLGLSMTHDIVVQMHGGNLQVETAPGDGAAFIITLPRRMPAQAPTRQETA